ncbi:MAG: transglutaminase domain-containing protein [Anaerolineales bacterium]|nr:transglutaminase domain-containing protein [Anaerolineales bacterium]
MSRLSFFAAHSFLSDPGRHAARLEAAPGDLAGLSRMVQGLLLHIFWAERYGVQLAEARQGEVQLRTVAAKLHRSLELDPRPLTEARPPERRLVGNCRDFTLLLTALLRQQGVPARARCGFARYFIPGHYEDHWVCEYWHAGEARWVLVDAQLDDLQRQALGIRFDPLDVPRDQFLAGGRAWQMCRSGQADPAAFGIADLHGLWFVRGDLVRDVAALNKVELLPWDGWGLADARDEDLLAGDLALLDEVADLTAGDVPEFDQLRGLYQNNAGLRVPAVIRSYAAHGVQTVALDELRDGQPL